MERVAAAPALATTSSSSSSWSLATGSTKKEFSNTATTSILSWETRTTTHRDFCTAPAKNNESFTCCGPDLSIYTFAFLGLEKFRKIAACESIFCSFVYIFFFFFSLVVFVWCVCCGGTTKSWLTVHSRRVASRLSKSRSRAASDKSQSQNLASLRPGQTHRAAQSTQHSTAQRQAGRRAGGTQGPNVAAIERTKG